MDFDHYSTLADANDYFDNRLHETAWAAATSEQRTKALYHATQDVDALNYVGYKTPVYDLLESDPDADDDAIDAADATQPLQFPRDGSDTVPDDILIAVYEIAYERLAGRDPNKEFENLALTSDGAGSIRASYDRSGMPPRHLANGIVSYAAWVRLQRYLADNNAFLVKRV